MKLTKKQRRTAKPLEGRRHGLSTLEMVLCLPVLLFIMALMVNFGTVACWKVRSLSIAREAVWSTRWPRSGNSNPRPAYWPQGAGISAVADGNVAALDDPRVDLPVARGPLPLGTMVNEELLDPTRGLRRGSADITRGFPMLGGLGDYELEAKTSPLDDKWQFRRMGMSSTWQRRIPIIYVLAKAPSNLATAYVQAVSAVLYAPFRDDLQPMDNDEEYRAYGMRFGWGRRSPVFYPRLRRFCTLDEKVALERQDNLVDRIQGKVERNQDGRVLRRVSGVAERMTQSFISLYQRVIRALQASGVPGTEAEISMLQARIDTLNQFLQTLQNN